MTVALQCRNACVVRVGRSLRKQGVAKHFDRARQDARRTSAASAGQGALAQGDSSTRKSRGASALVIVLQRQRIETRLKIHSLIDFSHQKRCRIARALIDARAFAQERICRPVQAELHKTSMLCTRRLGAMCPSNPLRKSPGRRVGRAIAIGRSPARQAGRGTVTIITDRLLPPADPGAQPASALPTDTAGAEQAQVPARADTGATVMSANRVPGYGNMARRARDRMAQERLPPDQARYGQQPEQAHQDHRRAMPDTDVQQVAARAVERDREDPGRAGGNSCQQAGAAR